MIYELNNGILQAEVIRTTTNHTHLKLIFEGQEPFYKVINNNNFTCLDWWVKDEYTLREENYIAYNAGCGIWEVEKYDSSILWHEKEYRGTKNDCKDKVELEMMPQLAHYPNASYGSIHDY